ncbi:MAG: B12-binding domain-containing radical SAM protein [bacterium]
MSGVKQVLFLQLPQLDNDLSGDNENVPMAAAYLQYSAELAGEGRYYSFARLPNDLQSADNATLLDEIVNRSPTVLACTLYLWNIERTLRLVRLLKARRPVTRVLLGGPEAAYTHPFLFRQSVADAIGVGEGETIFPTLLRAFRTGKSVNYSTVAINSPGGYRWGTQAPEPVSLSRTLPPPGYEACRPDTRGMAYLETSRGCPMHCIYCRYPQLRRAMSFLTPVDILKRVFALRRMGATEIRFVDPTFNSHPQFRDIITQLARFNRDGNVKFFAELNACRMTREEAHDLARAGFAEIEVGVQSRDPVVLKSIRRPTDLARLDEGIGNLIRERIKVTVDIMYGLPLQRLGDVRRSLQWALKLRGVNVQCLQTLLLPGTELRDKRRTWRLQALARPPYAVTRTSTMKARDYSLVESLIAKHPKLRCDIPTTQFVSETLELFPEQIPVDLKGNVARRPACSRRAYLVSGANLFGQSAILGRFIKACIRRDPDALLQFVLCPQDEEPLDLLEDLIAIIRNCPKHLLDRYSSVSMNDKIASRRLMVQLPANRSVSRDWIEAAESLLIKAFF